MFEQYSDGYCPECLLNNQMVPMVLNKNDSWECPECHLQATKIGCFFALLHVRGKGILKTMKATDNVCGMILTKTTSSDTLLAEATGFRKEQDLRDFLATIQPNP